jgi:tetratricopeptide (TPR) repeat protein
MKINKIFLILLSLLFSVDHLYCANYEAYKTFLKGTFDLKTGHIEDCIKNYEKVADLDKDAFSVYKNLAYLYWHAGKTDKAFETAKMIDKIDGSNPQTTNFLATFYLVANEPETAKQYWEKTLKLNPEDEIAIAYLASYYYSGNELKKSKSYWDKFLKQQPDNAIGYFQLGIVQEKLNMTNDALASYDKAININTDFKEAYIAKARIYKKIGQFDLAIKEYENYTSLFPDNALVLMYLGKCFYEAHNYQKAKEYLLKAKKKLPNNQTISLWLGIIYEKNRQFEKAAIELENVEKADEKNIPIIVRLGYFYAILKNYQKAEKKFLKGIEIVPNNYEILYLAALNYMDWKKYNKAIEYFKKSINIESKFSDAHFYLGLAYDKEKDFANTELALLKAIELNPKHTKAMNYLGYTYADKGIKLKESEMFLVKAVTLEPKNSTYLDSLGWLYYRLGNFKLAEKFLLEAVRITKDPLMYEHLGDTYIELNKPVEAWTLYSMSFDFKENKNIRKKLDSVQKQIPLEDLYKQMLLRSESNYLKLFPLKTGFKAKISSSLLSKKFYVPFFCYKNKSIRIDLPSIIIPGRVSVHIKNGTYEFVPKAIENQLSQEISNIISKTCEVLNGNFYKQFVDATVTQKGKRIIYSKNGKELILNLDTALIKSFSDENFRVNISKYEKFVISNVPKKIKFVFKDIKIEGLLETAKIYLISGDNKNENNSQSSGKN